ncbi:unnamed protein product [Adineta steineri]|uniref:Inositol polyphosphate-related phosphatase domain-containing protein n=1 Tax=Adineta steineri TaxID=433720 RepID=A0A819DQZ7_9BILA|nr:unnamed protein product [Adineta steineri]CAF3834431.1 unnamed protein product [Adineta steineri]
MQQILSVTTLSILILFNFQLIYSQPSPFRFRIITWNVGNSEPDCNTFEHLTFSSASNSTNADLIIFGFQETSKKLIGSNSFRKTLTKCLKNKNYIELLSDYVGSNINKPIWLYIYIPNKTMQSQRVNILTLNTERTLKIYQDKILEKYIGYKGIIASRIQIDKLTNIIFANMHLPAGEGKIEERCKLLSKFYRTYHQIDDIKDDYMFIFGDQNWRTLKNLSINNILEAIKKHEYKIILDNDELTQMRKNKNIQCLEDFFEASIKFPPTYKYEVNSDEYQTEKNHEDRRPSYTDRILISDRSKDLKIIQYAALNEIKLSDHRPVFADFMLYHKTKHE